MSSDWYNRADLSLPAMGAWNLPRPTTDDLSAVNDIAENISGEVAKLYLQHMVQDGELLELMRREAAQPQENGAGQ